MTKPAARVGYVTIARFSSNTEPHNGVTIWLEDATTHRRVVEIELTIPSFGEVISGRGYVECKYILYGGEA